MIVVLFEWLKVEKSMPASPHSKHPLLPQTPLHDIPGSVSLPRDKSASRTQTTLRSRLVTKSEEPVRCALCEEHRAYQRIASSFVRPRS
jgi:hypothetical protein